MAPKKHGTPEKDPQLDANEIVPGLWVGSLSAAENSKMLLAKHIVSVVTVAARLNPQLSWRAADVDHIAYKYLDIEDHPRADLLGVLPDSLRAIDKLMKARSEGPGLCGVLVHCASGMSRSVAVCMAWLMVRQGASLDEAFERVSKARPQAQPNFGFLQCLRLLEDQTCDVRSAHKLWIKANDVSDKTRDRLIEKLRKRADACASKAADLEERLQSECGGPDPDRSTMRKLLNKLKQLLQEIEKATPMSTTDDTVASAVRQGSQQKVMQLLLIWQSRLGSDSLQDAADESTNDDTDVFSPLPGEESPWSLPGPGNGPVTISL